MINDWSRKVVARDVAEVESADIAADLVQRACLRERYCRPRSFCANQSPQQPLILHADNDNALDLPVCNWDLAMLCGLS